ncbi:MAG: c-type cytochrome [Pseudomonadota bacterium]
MRILGVLMVFAAAGQAFADGLPGDPAAGLSFARDHCAECHYVEDEWSGVSPYNAPAFHDIAQEPRWTPLSLRVFLRTPHQNLLMPDFILTDAEADDVISHILSLRKAD